MTHLLMRRMKFRSKFHLKTFVDCCGYSKMNQAGEEAGRKHKAYEATIEQQKNVIKDIEDSLRKGNHPEIKRVMDLLEVCEQAHQEKIAMLVQREIRIRELEQ